MKQPLFQRTKTLDSNVDVRNEIKPSDFQINNGMFAITETLVIS